MVVSFLAIVVLRIVSNQASLTHHQVSRIQAQYAAKAAMVYALEQLRLGNWRYAPPFNSCPNPGGCPINDPSLPISVYNPPANTNNVRVIFCPAGSRCQGSNVSCTPPVGSNINFCINSFVSYNN